MSYALRVARRHARRPRRPLWRRILTRYLYVGRHGGSFDWDLIWRLQDGAS